MKYWWLANASDYNTKLIVNTHCYASCPFEYSSIKIINQWNYAFRISKFTLPDKTENIKILCTAGTKPVLSLNCMKQYIGHHTARTQNGLSSCDFTYSILGYFDKRTKLKPWKTLQKQNKNVWTTYWCLNPNLSFFSWLLLSLSLTKTSLSSLIVVRLMTKGEED